MTWAATSCRSTRSAGRGATTRGLAKVKLDENLPASLGDVLIAHDHEVDTVLAENLVGYPDGEVAAATAGTVTVLHHGRLRIRLP